MRAVNERDGELKDEILRLENEVAIWRNRGIQRQGTTTAKCMWSVSPSVLSRSLVPQRTKRRLPQGRSGAAGKGPKVA